ncbi:NADH:ubiquinone oxidoreductase subunit 5 (subunit L)/multisubunit Na+/H+ antiporter MnhA subunit [Haloactinopolyspora alba]|uniref:NADH:ubiquinone oxidoreductase subunit 5 (Subunit L)/multisubunit Na+/H+ antiporter MnhA subunit n=1 Tax=Haloactinopolyspora alba TaxID=648780 RepID=A0A2P8ECA6_9ACTN|nr:proton-conducting transporter membrane subunit [Haloactinopolyspora alba]PSL07057.1 NADH:ubiquinone oxidoreductase subunit 5 (subunit L)/multisubunit Na+/H+ antiporter MnhA subunit [Haloactinopolyspora alba]
MTADVPAVALACLVLLPAVAGPLLLIAGRRADRAAGAMATVVAAVSVALAVAVAVSRPEVSAPFLGTVDGGALALAVDGLSAVLVVTVSVVSLAVVVFAVVDLPPDAARARFFGHLLLFVAAMLATVTATTLPALLLAWEVMGATSYALIGYRWEVPGKLSAGTTAFVTTRAGDLGLYVAAGAVFAGTGTLELSGWAAAGGWQHVAAGAGWQHVAAAGILVAALGKSAQLPFSGWLSAAMEGPSPVSALLHSATMVAAGGYLLLRTMPLLEASGWAATTAAWVGAATALVLGAVACAQTDIKQLLAASTSAQIGFVVLAAGVGAGTGGTGHLVAHAAVKAGLFVAAGAWLTSLGTQQLSGLRGVARRHPGMGVPAAVAALALAGVPPLALWASKDEVLAGAGGGLRVAGLAAAAVSAVYAGRVLGVVFARPAPDAGVARPRRVPGPAVAVAGALAAAAAGLGVLAVPGVAHALEDVVSLGGQPSPGAADLVLSGGLAVAVLAATLAWPEAVARSTRTVLAPWAGLRWLLSPRPVLAAARVAARIDDRVIDRAVLSVPAGLRRLAAGVARADDGGVDRAVRTAAAAIRRAGDAARRPQTGLVHQYYAQAVVGLGVLLVLLLVVR